MRNPKKDHLKLIELNKCFENNIIDLFPFYEQEVLVKVLQGSLEAWNT